MLDISAICFFFFISAIDYNQRLPAASAGALHASFIVRVMRKSNYFAKLKIYESIKRCILLVVKLTIISFEL